MQDEVHQVPTHGQASGNQEPIYCLFGADFEDELFAVVALQHLFVLLHVGIGDGHQRGMPELLYWPQLHEISGVLAFDCARDTDIYHMIFPCSFNILRIMHEEVFKL